MAPAATAANGVVRRLEPSRFIINASSPAAVSTRRLRRRLYLPTCTSGAQQHQRRHAHAISVDLPPPSIAELLGSDSAPQTESAPAIADAPPAPQSVGPNNSTLELVPRIARFPSINYKRVLPHALRVRDADVVVNCMLFGAHDAAFVASVPPVAFTEILRLVSTHHAFEAAEQVLRNSWWARGLGVSSITGSVDQFLKAARIMVAHRTQANIPLGLADYKVLLRLAATAADRSVAMDLWGDLHKGSLVPDTECYNALMHALLWDRRMGRNDSTWRRPLGWRADGYFQLAKKKGILPFGPPSGSYEGIVSALFDELLNSERLGDETTIVHLITAHARDGDLTNVKSILQRIWNIRVDELAAHGVQRSPPKSLPPSSPMHPTSRLLYAVAHCFGINSELPVALRLVDFISTNYKLSVPADVWSELLNWTYVQSTIRSGRFKKLHRVQTQLPLGATERLWSILTREPYNVRPTMKMFHLSVNGLTKWQRHDMAFQRIRDGIALYHQHCINARVATRQVEAAKNGLAVPGAPIRSLSKLLATRAVWLAAVKRDRAYIRQWCKMYLKRGYGFGFTEEYVDENGERARRREIMAERLPEWAYIDVPNFVAEFRGFCDPVVKYRTHTGIVELELLQRKIADNVAIEGFKKGYTPEQVISFWEGLKVKQMFSKLVRRVKVDKN